MSRKWKQQTAMFVFAMIAMTRTIFAMKRPCEGTGLKMNPADDQTDDIISEQEIEDGLEEAQVYQHYIGKYEKSRYVQTQKTEKRRTSRQKALNRQKTAAWKDADFDVNEASGSNAESDFEDFNENHQPIKERNETMQPLVNWNTFIAEKLIFEKQRVEKRLENTPVKVKKVKNAKHFAHFLGGEDLLKYTLLDTRHKNFMECIPVKLKHGSGYVFWNMNARTVERVDLGPEIVRMKMLNFVKDVFSSIPDTDSPTDYDFSFDATIDYKKWFMMALHKQTNTIIGRQLQWECVSPNNSQTFECIPVALNDGSGYVSWNANARTVEYLNFGYDIMHFQTERLNFVKDVFSRIPDTDSPTDYDFIFDTAAGYKKWFMLAIHKRKNVIIGRKWEYVSRNNFQTSNFEPCNSYWRWSTKNQIGMIFHWIKLRSMILPDGICKLLLAHGFNFPPDCKNKKQKICENDFQCALNEKLDKSAKFLLLSYSDVKETGLNDPESLESMNFAVNDRIEDRYIVKDADIKKAFRNNLCESFTFMMNSKNWPEKLWKDVLESEHEQSKEMIKLVLERIKAFPKVNQYLDDLLKTFDKLMYNAGHESTSGNIQIEACLQMFHKSIRLRVYQRLLFFGVVKRDLEQCKFAVRNGASLQERTSSRDSIVIANKFCTCERAPHPRGQCLHKVHPDGNYLLSGMTAFQIATHLANGFHGDSYKDCFNKTYIADLDKIKDYLRRTEYEKDRTISLDTESEDDSKNNKRKRKINK